MANKIQVMLAEDHVLMREGTRNLINLEDDIQVIAEAGDGEEAVALADLHRPDVVVMDIGLPRLDGLEATRRIKAIHPATAILVLTAHDDDQYVFDFLDAGVAGYLLKDVRAADLIQAIRAVYAGESVLHPAVARKVTDHFAQRATQQHVERSEVASHQLDPRELQVLELAARWMTNREIASELSTSVFAVQDSLSDIFRRLGVGSRTEAVLYALRKGWLTT
jgi:DNA-binding NarL/FixJ family response regulator